MTSRRPLFLAVLLALPLAAPASADEPLLPEVSGRVLEAPLTKAPFCGGDANTAAGTLPVYNWQDNFIALTRLGNHWMPTFGDGDSMTSPFWLDQGTALPFGSDGLRETWYISRDNLANTAPLYRLLGNSNHMDSPATSEGVHTLNMGVPHGYPWTVDAPGLQPIRRYLNSSLSDHRTWLFNQTPAGYVTNATWWTSGATPRLGYQRFGNPLDMCGVFADAYGLYQLDNPTFTIDFNKIWGGAIGKILYKPLGKQLVSESIGDMAQSTLFRGTSADPPNSCCVYNPTESGGADVLNYGNTKRWTGSPILSASFSGTNPKTFTRTVKPLNFTTNAFQGNDPWSPLLWRGEFRKTTTLGHQIGATIHNDVIRILFEAKLDADAPAAMDGMYNMNNTFWLNMNQFGNGELNDFDLELFDVATNTTSPIAYPPDWRQDTLLSSQNNKAVVIVDATGTFAAGMFRPGVNEFWKILYWCSSGAPEQGLPCPTANQLFVIDSFNNHILSRTAWESEQVYFVAGTPATVRQRLRQIAGF